MEISLNFIDRVCEFLGFKFDIKRSLNIENQTRWSYHKPKFDRKLTVRSVKQIPKTEVEKATELFLNMLDGRLNITKEEMSNIVQHAGITPELLSNTVDIMADGKSAEAELLKFCGVKSEKKKDDN